MNEAKEIKYGSAEYETMVALRYKILREPIGMTFTDSDLEKDGEDILLGLFYPKSDEIAACCILTHVSDAVVQLRQMAVDDFTQRKGLGSEMLLFAEQTALKNDYRYVYLHARKIAMGFYKKHGYKIEGDEFEEVGIPHFEMMKIID